MHRKAIRLATALLAATTVAACTTDSYETGNGRYSMLRGDFVVAHATGKNAIDYVLTDDGDSLTMTTDYSFSSVAKPDTFYRAQLYYNKVDDHAAEPIAFGVVPTLPVYPLNRIEKMKTDPVRFESAWVAKTKPYLNLSIDIMIGTTDGDNGKQTIAMAQNGDTLTFYHDQDSVPEYYSTRVYMSVPYDRIAADSFLLRVNTYDGWKEMRLKK